MHTLNHPVFSTMFPDLFSETTPLCTGSNSTHVVGCPPGLEQEVSLELRSAGVSEVIGQRLHLLVSLVVQQGMHRLQVLQQVKGAS